MVLYRCGTRRREAGYVLVSLSHCLHSCLTVHLLVHLAAGEPNILGAMALFTDGTGAPDPNPGSFRSDLCILQLVSLFSMLAFSGSSWGWEFRFHWPPLCCAPTVLQWTAMNSGPWGPRTLQQQTINTSNINVSFESDF